MGCIKVSAKEMNEKEEVYEKIYTIEGRTNYHIFFNDKAMYYLYTVMIKIFLFEVFDSKHFLTGYSNFYFFLRSHFLLLKSITALLGTSSVRLYWQPLRTSIWHALVVSSCKHVSPMQL